MRNLDFFLLTLSAFATLSACTDSSILINPAGQENCTEGSVICTDGERQTCIDGEWDVETCPNGCNAKGTDCKTDSIKKECDSGSSICINDVMKTCIDEEWVQNPCKNGCNEDATACRGDEPPKADCQPGEISCASGIKKICTENSTYQQTECPYGCNEAGNDCAAKPDPEPECSGEQTLCENSTKKTCSGGKWQSTNCPDGCNEAGNDCATITEPEPECTGEQTLCENSTKKTCSGGKWQSTNCPDGCNEAGNDCAVPRLCTENEVSCTDGKLQKCTGNAWTKAEDCPNGCSKTGKACAKCREGSTCQNGKQTTCKDEKTTETTCQYGCDAAGNKCDEIDQMQPTRYLMKTVHSPITPYVVEQMKKIKAKNNSRNDNVFIEIGDSHYDYDDFMVCYSKSSSQKVTLGSYSNLQSVIDEFQKTKDSFKRDSLAAVGGTATRYALSGSPNYIAQEVSAMNPRFAFFGHGSNDIGNGSFTYRNFTYSSSGSANGYAWAIQDYYRQFNKAMDQLINAGIIPLISGIVPNFSSPSKINYLTSTNPPACKSTEYPRYVVQAFNAVSRGIAEARQLPWLDTYNVFYPLKDHGLLTSDHVHGSRSSQYCDFSSTGLAYGVNNRNLHSVIMLDSAWRTVIKGEEAVDPIEEPFRGKGTQADPYLITSIPYTHQGNTNSGESKIDVYSGCDTAKEGGKEIYYKLVINEKKYVRMFAVSASGVDVDIHIMKGAADAAKCIARSDIMLHGSLEAGTYYIAVDTFSGNGADGPGQYLFGIVECDNKKNGGSSAYDYDVDTLCQSKPIFNATE